jgi:hypothetical protein
LNSAAKSLRDGKRDSHAEASLEATVKMMQLLREIREFMLSATQAWNSFCQMDLAFFSDLDDRDINVARYNMKSAFETLVELEQKLVFLDRYFADSVNFVSTSGKPRSTR